jgi:hypothetical protein
LTLAVLTMALRSLLRALGTTAAVVVAAATVPTITTVLRTSRRHCTAAGVFNQLVGKGASETCKIRKTPWQAAGENLIDVLEVAQEQIVTFSFLKKSRLHFGADGRLVVSKILALQKLGHERIQDLFALGHGQLSKIRRALSELRDEGVTVQCCILQTF